MTRGRDEEAIRVDAERPQRIDLLGDPHRPSSAENAAPERPATMIAVMSGASSRVTRAPPGRPRRCWPELLQLHRGLECRHQADQEVDHEDDGDAVGPSALHEPRNIAPVDGDGHADRVRPGPARTSPMKSSP